MVGQPGRGVLDHGMQGQKDRQQPNGQQADAQPGAGLSRKRGPGTNLGQFACYTRKVAARWLPGVSQISAGLSEC